MYYNGDGYKRYILFPKCSAAPSATNRFREGEEQVSIKPENCLGRNQCEGK